MPDHKDEIKPFRPPAAPDLTKTAQTIARTRAQQDYQRHLVHRRVVDIPPASRALFLAPHPDDIVIGCGGTIVKMIDRGVSVRLAYLTDGRAAADEAGENAMVHTRAEEARGVSAQLGLPEPILVGWNERTFTRPENEDLLVERVAQILQEVGPDHVFLPFYGDVHGDHRYANHLLARALRSCGSRPVIYGYEVWSLAPPGVVVDITNELEKKKELLAIYRSQLALLDYMLIVESVARLRAPLAPGAAACEVFHALRGDAFVDLVESMDLRSPESLQSEVLLTSPETMPSDEEVARYP